MTKLLLDHLKSNHESLQKLSQHINLAQNGTNIGNAREGLISNFLEQNLPEFIKFHTGEIFDSNEKRSGQIDIVVHPITSPKLHLFGALNLFPAECVMSAIEVKSSLNKMHLNLALDACYKLKQLEFVKEKNSLSSIHHPNKIPFIIFGFSGPSSNRLMNNLRSKFNLDKNSTNYPELILVLDKGYSIKKSAWHRCSNFEESFELIQLQENVLQPLFTLLLNLTENWTQFPAEHIMPIDSYTKDFVDYGLF